MEDPYKLAKNILLSGEGGPMAAPDGGFTSIELYGASACENAAANVMEINYCKEGRSECLFGERRYCYMSAGDLSFGSLHDSAHQSEFPTAHYHGITVTVDFSAITVEMEKVLELLAVDIARIRALSQAA